MSDVVSRPLAHGHSVDATAPHSPSAFALAPPAFHIVVLPDRAAVHVVPVGELDLATVDRVRQQFDELLEVGFERIVIDLRKLEFIDSSGMSLLLDTCRASRQDGWQFSIIQGRRQVRRLFEITGLLDQLPFAPFDKRESAGG